MIDLHRLVRRASVLAVLLIWLPVAGAQIVIDAVPGGVVEIPLASLEQPRPEAFFGQRRILVVEFGRRWAGLVGLPLGLVPGRYVIQFQPGGEEDAIVREFTVYPRRRTREPVPDLQGPPSAAAAVELTWRDSLDADLPLDAPVALPARQIFGQYRQISDNESGYVDYVTFRITAPTPVKAPDAGLVAAVARHETGVYLWIDHGMGLFSRIGPLVETSLKQADPVTPGQIIGRVALAEEQASRPLYLSVFLNGASVNPFLISNIEKDGVPDGPNRSGSG